MSQSNRALQEQNKSHEEIDLSHLRSDFPSMSASEIYLDSAATSLTPSCVLEAMNNYYTKYCANVNRGSYKSSMLATDAYQSAHNKIADYIGAKPNELVLTQNATTAINFVALSIKFSPGDEIILSTVEHLSNMAPWVRHVNESGVIIKWFDPGKHGLFDKSAFSELMTDKTKLVALTHTSNVLGSIFPVSEVGKMCKARDVLFFVDACQSIPHSKISVEEINCDFLVFSGHKMLGPTGIGGLFVKESVAEKIQPAFLGSESMDTSVCPGLGACSSGAMPKMAWRTIGTPAIPEAIGLAAAIDYLSEIGLDTIDRHGKALADQAIKELRLIDGVELYGDAEGTERSSIVSFNIQGIPSLEVNKMLDQDFGIAVRAGTHCAIGYFMENQSTNEAYGNIRASFYLYNTKKEVDVFVDAIKQICNTCL